MNQPATRSRKTSQISSRLDKHLSLYTLAASAAGVGLVAFAQPVEAEVVYTPVHVTFKTGTSYLLDIDNDGTPEVRLNDTNIFRSGNGLFAEHWGNAGGSFQFQSGFAVALNRGEKIGPGNTFSNTCVSTTGCTYGHVLAGATQFNGAFGDWVNVTDRYLGLRFHVSGKTYYGWARLSVRVSGLSVGGILTGYAYENTPNHAIRAGQTSGTAEESSPDSSEPATRAPAAEKPISQGLQPATPGVLALGAQGVPFWRADEPVIAGH